MGILVNAQRGAHAPSLTVASMVIVIPAFEVLRVWGLEVTGMASALAAGESHGFYTCTAVGSGGSPTTIELKPENEEETVPGGWSCVFGYSTEPVVELGGPRILLPFQPAGGVGEYRAEGSPLIIHNKSASAINAALRSVAGTSQIALRARLELGV